MARGETVCADDFRDVDPRKWGDLYAEEPMSGQKFLGLFHKHSQPAMRTFDIPSFTHSVTIEFLLYEIDNWDDLDGS